MNNPLVQDFLTPFETAPFSKIKNEHFKPAFEWAIVQAKKEIDEITEDPDLPTFENTMEKLEFSGDKLSRISSIEELPSAVNTGVEEIVN